jgi:hypothetical protein
MARFELLCKDHSLRVIGDLAGGVHRDVGPAAFEKAQAPEVTGFGKALREHP